MSKAVVRSRGIVPKKRTCRGCGTTLRPPPFVGDWRRCRHKSTTIIQSTFVWRSLPT